MLHSTNYFKQIAMLDNRFSHEFNGGHYRAIRLVRIPKHASSKFVFHDDNEILYVVQGKCKVQAYGQYLELGPQDMIYIPQGYPHRVINTGDVQLKVVAASNSAHIRKIPYPATHN